MTIQRHLIAVLLALMVLAAPATAALDFSATSTDRVNCSTGSVLQDVGSLVVWF